MSRVLHYSYFREEPMYGFQNRVGSMPVRSTPAVPTRRLSGEPAVRRIWERVG